MAHPPLRLELDSREQLPRLDQRAQAARRVGRARERLVAFQLGDQGLEPLREHDDSAVFPAAAGAQREHAPIVDTDAKPATDAAPAQGPVGRIKVDVPLEERLHQAGAEAQRKRISHHAVEKVQRRNVRLPLGQHR